MHITELGAVLIPLSLLCCFSARMQVILMILPGAFEAAASIVFGSLGLQPALVPTIVLCSNLALVWLLGGRFSAMNQVIRLMAPLWLLLIYAVLGAVILPRLFAGSVLVHSQKNEGFAGEATPLAFDFGAVTQSVYFIINVCATFAVALVVSSRPVKPTTFFNIYLSCGLLTFAIALWQLSNKLAGVPFPADFFYSNPGWAILQDQTFAGVPRVNGPFTEPAALASFLLGIFYSTFWLYLHGYKRRMINVCLGCSLLGILISTSTTGIAAVLLGGLFILGYLATRAAPDVSRRFRGMIYPVIVVGGIAAVTVPIIAPKIITSIGIVISSTANKSDSDSYDQRTNTDSDSLILAIQTFGLGVGWGSNRSSSLIPGILASVGVIGTGLLVTFVVNLRRAFKQATHFLIGEEKMVLTGAAAGLTGHVVAAILSAPGLYAVVFYALLGLMIGVLARARFRAASMAVHGSSPTRPLAFA